MQDFSPQSCDRLYPPAPSNPAQTQFTNNAVSNFIIILHKWIATDGRMDSITRNYSHNLFAEMIRYFIANKLINIETSMFGRRSSPMPPECPCSRCAVNWTVCKYANAQPCLMPHGARAHAAAQIHEILCLPIADWLICITEVLKWGFEAAIVSTQAGASGIGIESSGVWVRKTK